jgi:cell division protein FtsQ
MRKRKGKRSSAKHQSFFWHGKFSMSKIMLLGGGFLFVSLCFLALPSNVLQSTNNKIQDLCRATGIVLKNVYLEGQNYTDRTEIIKALNVEIGEPILNINLSKLQNNLKSIGWIQDAVIERQLPDTLYIWIVERTPLALWQNSGKMYIIDQEGKVIEGENNFQKFSHLILLIGEDAPLYAKSLFSFIDKEKDLFQQISSATRISERRWNIRFQNGLVVKLPEEEAEKYWQYVVNMYKKKILFNDIKTLDLRVPNKLYIEMDNEEKF